MKYSICFLDEMGRALRSEFETFESDDEAVAYARAGVPDNDIVEVWKGEGLLARLFRDQKNLPDYLAKPSSEGQRPRVSDWESEGGATSAGPALSSQV